MIDKDKNIDGYPEILLPVDEVKGCKASGTDLKTIIYEALKQHGRIAAEADGRICTASDASMKQCQADTWLR
jgi:hypothetical protein